MCDLFHSSGAGGFCGVDPVDCFFELSHRWSSAFLLGCFSFSISPPGDSFSARHGSAMRAARGCNVPALGGRHAGTARPQGNDRETREFLTYFTPHVFELQELGLLFISQRGRHQRRTLNKETHTSAGTRYTGDARKEKRKRWMNKQSSTRKELLERINDDWRRKIASSGPGHCLERNSSGFSCEALLVT